MLAIFLQLAEVTKVSLEPQLLLPLWYNKAGITSPKM
jgi:hypothetical protein